MKSAWFKLSAFGKFLVLAIFCFTFFISQRVEASVLTPGTIYSCGEIATTGTYTLSATSTFTPVSGNDCFIVTSGGTSTQTVINGNGRTITGNVNGNGVNYGDNGHSFTLQNLTVVGTTSANGASSNISNCSNNGGNGGNIILSTSTSIVITANAGKSSYGRNKSFQPEYNTNPNGYTCSNKPGGSGGNVTINGRDLDFSTTTISAKGGYQDYNGDADGNLVINYSNTINVIGVNLSALSSFTINSPLNTPGNLGPTGGGTIGILPGGTINNISQCNLALAGTYTLGSNLTGNCRITSDNVILDGAGYTINGNVDGSSLLSYVSNGRSFTINNITVTGTTTGAGQYGIIGDSTNSCYSIPGFINGGTININNSTTTTIVTNGAPVKLYGIYSCGDLGVAGKLNITSSRFNYLESIGEWGDADEGQDNTVTINSDILDLSTTTFNLYDGVFSNYGVRVIMNFNSLITNSATNFIGGGAHPLLINNISIGDFLGTYNPMGAYFNDNVAGAGHDGSWTNPLNWWNDVLFTIPSGGVPIFVPDINIYSNILDNLGVSPVTKNLFTFNNGAINTIDLNTNKIIFNGTSTNMGNITASQVIFNGNQSENNATSSIFEFNIRGVNSDYKKVFSSSINFNILAFAQHYVTNPNGSYNTYLDIYKSIDLGLNWTLISSAQFNNNRELLVSNNLLNIIETDGRSLNVSTDGGTSWMVLGPSKQWGSPTFSIDGTKFALIAFSLIDYCQYDPIYCGGIYISTDSGSTLTLSTSSPSTSWTNIISSTDGTKLLAVGSNGTYISNNFGTSWTLSTSTPGGISQFIATSDGTKLIAFGTGNIFVSTNFGTTWSTTTSPTLPRNATFSASSDGSQLVGVVNNGSLYISSDSGATWTPYGSVKPWTDVTQSADGTKIVGVTGQGIDMPLGSIYTMTNTPTLVHRVGVIASSTPIRQYSTTTDAGTRNFTDQNWIVQISGGVANLSSSTYNTTQDTFQELLGGSFITNPSINGGAALTPQYTISSPTANATTTKWHPSTNWASSTATTCLYSYDNYVTTHTVNCANNGSDIAKPATDGLQTLYLQATDVRGDLKQQSVTFSYDRTSPTFTSCGTDLLDESTRPYYYLNGNVTGDCIVATNNIVLYGNPATTSTTTSYTISGNVIATSTTNGYNVTVNNTTVNGSIIASGANNASGIGYRGGNISIDPSITGPVVSNGGNGTSQGGNGGNITILNSAGTQGTSTPVSANGGNATVCGYGGSGGTITITNSLYATPTSNAGTDMTATFAYGGQCPNVITGSGSSGGSSGAVSVTGQYNPQILQQNFNQLIQPNVPGPINLAPTPSAGGTSGVLSSFNPIGFLQQPNPISQTLQSISDAVVATTKNVIAAASNIVNSPTSKTVQTTGFFAGLLATLSLYSGTGFATPLAAAELPFIPVHLWNLVLMGLGIRKRTRPWGTVYDSVTKRPIDPAYVTVKDINGKVVAESFTDIDGRYGFLLPDGTYYISVKKSNYEFPSKKLAGNTYDEIYSNLYFGEAVTVQGGQVLDKNIPMDQDNFDWNEYAKKENNISSFHSRNEKFIAVFSKYIYTAGLIVSSVAAILSPTTYNIIILVVYIAIYMLMRFGIKRKKFGQIIHKENHKPLPFSIVRVVAADHQTVLGNNVSDATGRYYCIVPKGQYYIDVEEKKPDGTYSRIYESDLITSDSGIVNSNIEI